MSLQVTDSNTPEIDSDKSPSSGVAASGPAADRVDPAARAKPEPPITLKRRVIGMVTVGAVLALLIEFTGLPTDPVKIFLCLLAVEIAWNSHRPWRSHANFVRDWIAVVILLVVYNFSRGYADNSVTPHITEMIHADEWLFGWGTGGEIPSVWLQDHLYHAARAQWYDVVVSFVYFSHFLAAPIVAAVLWFRNRPAWGAFVRRWFTLSALGLITYFVYPAMPPWLAAQDGYLPPVAHGVATRGWYAIGMVHGGNLLNAAQLDAANLIAAMPSLHSAFALLICIFFMQRTRKRWWPLLLAYPLAMTFSLVYAGEHYVIDVLVGWAYVGLSFLLVGLAERWWRRRVQRSAAAKSRAASQSADAPAPATTD
jgi:membrane-associated phospholipid phosphatase